MIEPTTPLPTTTTSTDFSFVFDISVLPVAPDNHVFGKAFRVDRHLTGLDVEHADGFGVVRLAAGDQVAVFPGGQSRESEQLGGFAAGAALYARDRRGPKFAFQHLIYPMIDDRTAVREDLHPYVGEFVWTQESNYFGWRSLLGQEPGSADVSPYAAAARAADVSGLPPTYISVGGLDLFLEENLTYADRLSRAGVPVEFHLYPRAYHGFYRATNARVTRQAEHDTREALRRFLHG
jgi:dipeptidyl aminopeptidase/acylaminoacyl peptidase